MISAPSFHRADQTAEASFGMHGGGRDRSGKRILDKTAWNTTSVGRQRQARDAPWSCGNQLRVIRSQHDQPSLSARPPPRMPASSRNNREKKTWVEFRVRDPLKTDMTAG